MSLANIDKYPLLKSRVKAHQRRTKRGKVTQVREHEVNGHKGFHHPDMKNLTKKQHADRGHYHLLEGDKQFRIAVKHYKQGNKKKAIEYGAKSGWHSDQTHAHEYFSESDTDKANRDMFRDIADSTLDRHKIDNIGNLLMDLEDGADESTHMLHGYTGYHDPKNRNLTVKQHKEQIEKHKEQSEKYKDKDPVVTKWHDSQIDAHKVAIKMNGTQKQLSRNDKIKVKLAKMDSGLHRLILDKQQKMM